MRERESEHANILLHTHADTHTHTYTHTHTHTRALAAFLKEILYLAAQPCMALQQYTNSPPLKKCHLYTRGQIDFKNMTLPLHEKHEKKCFSRSMGSTKTIFATPLQRNTYFVFVIFTAEGCQKWQNVLPTLHGKHKKVMRFTEHEKHQFGMDLTPSV